MERLGLGGAAYPCQAGLGHRPMIAGRPGAFHPDGVPRGGKQMAQEPL